MQRQERKQKGITLVALVITIIVLLLLAGVTISLLVGDNGIIYKAMESSKNTEVAREKEQIELAVLDATIEDSDNVDLTLDKLKNSINKQLRNEEVIITDNTNGKFLITFKNSGREYEVSDEGVYNTLNIVDENPRNISW